MATDVLRSLWAEPRPTNAPDRGPRDWALAAAFICWSVVEVVLREGMAPLPLLAVAALAAIAPLPWRRAHPLVAAAVAFGLLTVVDIVRILTGSQGALPSSVSATLVLTYSLFRWGSGREAAGGLGLILVWLPITFVADSTSLADSVAGYAFFLSAATLGAAVRYRARIRIRDIDEAKAHEREQLARELHDTVAHRVSAIAVQAQAGQAVAAQHPEAAVETLAVIEETAKRTLAEMRAMVGALRGSDDASRTPQGGVGDLHRLADRASGTLRIDVELSGDLDDLGPLVDAAVYRIAQESITNAIRHARHASRVSISVVGHDERVELTVSDDGTAASTPSSDTTGYGLLGMDERAKLLGGTVTSGPSAGGGWSVVATLPKAGVHA